MNNNVKQIDISNKEHQITEMLSHQFTDSATGTEQFIIIPERLGKGMIRRINIKKGLEIIISDIELLKTLTVHVEEEEFIEFNYCLSGNTIYEMNGQQFEICKPTSHAYYLQQSKGQLEIEANNRSQTVEIRMLPEHLLDYFQDETDQKNVQVMLESLKGQLTSYRLSPVIKQCIFEILQSPYRGGIKNMYLEAKIMELVTLFFREVVFCIEHAHHGLQHEEIQKLKKARKLTLQYLDDPYSIKALARKVELNEFKLKSGFKQLFGNTVFGLIRSERMEKAAWLMKVKGYNVSETASLIGYSNISNFSVAFRKHFGCNPSQYIK